MSPTRHARGTSLTTTLGALALAACNGGTGDVAGEASQEDEGTRGREVAVTTLASSLQCAFSQPGVDAVASADALRELMVRSSMAPTQLMASAAPPPEVDFADTRVLVIALGPFPDAGHTLSAESPAQLDDAGVLTLTVEVTHPAPDAMTAQVLTSPCVVLSLPAGAGDQVAVVDQTGALLGSVRW